jgi:hypothetical protein
MCSFVVTVHKYSESSRNESRILHVEIYMLESLVLIAADKREYEARSILGATQKL